MRAWLPASFCRGLIRRLDAKFTMAGLDPATQRARVRGRNRLIGSRTLARWMAGSEAGHGEMVAVVFSALVVLASLHGTAFAQTIGTTGVVPGGITLVPGTVVTPEVGGSAATGRVPLAGLPGSPGVRNFDPQLGPAVPDNGGQYRVAPYPPIKPPLLNQSTLPQDLQTPPADLPQNSFGPPPVQFCPNGAVTGNGLC